MDLAIILLILVIAVLAAVVFLLLRKKPELEKKDSNSLLMLQQQINHISQVLDSKLSESNKSLQQQFSQSADIIRNVTERLTRLDETNRQVVGFADQLKNLQDILKNPKQRGILGEYYLETVLKNVLPPGTYAMQYRLGVDEDTGKELIPDAAIFVKEKIIPIDAKFSLENYNRIIHENDPSERERLDRKSVV